ncbi:MAG: glycosyltransferase family 9 protein [Pelobacteraceae bacterium]
MKLATMRVIDETVGSAVASVLGMGVVLFRHIFPRSVAPAPSEVKTIVCQKYLGMGSILNALPLIKALRSSYPDVRIVFLTLASNRDVVELCHGGDEILTIDTSSFTTFVRGAFASIMELRSHEVDICIDLEFYSKFSLIMSLLMGARVRVGLHMKKIRPSGILTNVVYYNSYKHLSDIYLAYATALGIQFRAEYFSSLLPSMGSETQRVLREKLGIDFDRPIIVVNVNAGDLFLFRRWPKDHFAVLIRDLLCKYPDYAYVMIGDAGDRDYVEQICAQVGSAHKSMLLNAAGLTTIPELFALIESAFLMISNDSGPMHIASLYGINLAAFFGPESPIVYGPVNRNSLVFKSTDQYCSPCLSVYDSKKCLYGEECQDNICLRSIVPAEIFHALEEHFLSAHSIGDL